MKIGETVTREALEPVVQILVRALETAAGRSDTPIPPALYTEEAETHWKPPETPVLLSFSGGVAQCMGPEADWQAYGDLGVLLGQAIRGSRLWEGDPFLAEEPIRATVIGAGAHSAQLSGSTVFRQNLQLPLKNLPVAVISRPEDLSAALLRQEGLSAVAWPGLSELSYPRLREAAALLAAQVKGPLILCLERDMAKALGQALALQLPPGAPILCIDRVRLEEGSYLDIGNPTAEAFPVVIKTLVLR